jgi:1-acyl-sn-glycerol-3-phosphate acyltransferase
MRWIAYLASRFLCRCLLGLATRRRVLHPERARQSGAWILAANHISHFDPPLIGIAVPQKIDWMAMSDLFRPRLAGAWLRAIDSFPVERARTDTQAVRTALRRLELGRIVGIFPEGGLRDGAASVLGGAALRRGIGSLQSLSRAPLIPCVILGSDRLYRAANWLPLRRVPVWIGFGVPICSKENAANGEIEEQLAEALRTLASEMRAHFALSDDDFPKPPKARMRSL